MKPILRNLNRQERQERQGKQTIRINHISTEMANAFQATYYQHIYLAFLASLAVQCFFNTMTETQ